MSVKRIILNLARIIGLSAGFFWVFVLLSGSFERNSPYKLQLMLVFILICINFASVVLALWSERIGGVLLVVSSIVLCAFAFFVSGQNRIVAMLVSGFPFLLSGVLFLIYEKVENNS